MDPAQKVLIGGGLINIVYGVLTGFAFASARQKSEFAPRYLVMAHTGPLAFGTMLMALSLAIPVSALAPDNEELAARLMVFFAVCIAVKDTYNWLAGITDEFVQKPVFSRTVGMAGVIGGMAGIAMLSVGVLRGYWAP
ncbi:MAG TPA: hypothetical protein VEL28_10740 [Candidatus Binatia bacterium]|nr:hypothetical protein [Candidatus Binatia bacterium]